jgi:hypothetical protein
MNAAGTQMIQITIPLVVNTIDAYLTTAASTTTYSVSIVGVYF